LNTRLLSLWVICFLAFACMMPAAASSAAPDESQPSPLRLVVLGDSLAIGYEPGMTASSIPYGYSDRLYEQSLLRGRATMVNYGLGGLSSAGLRTLLQAVYEGKPVR